MNPLALRGYLKIGWLTATGRTVGTADWGMAYDRVAPTYDDWNGRMATHTRGILPEVWLNQVRAHPQARLRVLDLACGNGTVTKALLERLGACEGLEVVGVDLSAAMVERCRDTIRDPRATFVQAEGRSYLRAQPAAAFDAVFCGWGLVYLPKAPVLREFFRVLAPGGWVGAIMNLSGTLAGVEEAYLDTMLELPSQIAKVMTIRFCLPRSASAFHRWFTRTGFRGAPPLVGSETVARSTPEDLLHWLTETGALAGCETLFRDGQVVRDRLLAHLGRRTGRDGSYQVTHRFVLGQYQKPPRSAR